jgi:hypothetical protein
MPEGNGNASTSNLAELEPVEQPQVARSGKWRLSGVSGLRSDLLCLLLLLVFGLALAWPVVQGKVPIAIDTLGLWGPQRLVERVPVNNIQLADSALLYYPWQVFTRESINNGEWPLWNPYVFAGYPYQGNPQTQLYYPVNWLLWLMPLALALQFSLFLHIWLAAAGAYVLARVLNVSWGGALVSGLAFAASKGHLCSQASHTLRPLLAKDTGSHFRFDPFLLG